MPLLKPIPGPVASLVLIGDGSSAFEETDAKEANAGEDLSDEAGPAVAKEANTGAGCFDADPLAAKDAKAGSLLDVPPSKAGGAPLNSKPMVTVYRCSW